MKSSFSPPVYVWQCPWDSKMARVGVSRIGCARKEQTRGSGQCPTGRTFCVGLTLNATLEGLPGRREVFLSYFPRPNATLFVITRPLIHNAMSILVPDRWIFVVKAGRAFSYGQGTGLQSYEQHPAPRSKAMAFSVKSWRTRSDCLINPLGTSTTIS